jgi:hypothetical protein
MLSSLGGLGGFLKASPEQLAAVGPLDGQQVALLTAVQRLAGASHSARQPVISSFRALQRFLRKHSLRADVVLATGGGRLSFDQLRGLVRLCLKHHAPAAILARSADGAGPAMFDSIIEATIVACSLEIALIGLCPDQPLGDPAGSMIPVVCLRADVRSSGVRPTGGQIAPRICGAYMANYRAGDARPEASKKDTALAYGRGGVRGRAALRIAALSLRGCRRWRCPGFRPAESVLDKPCRAALWHPADLEPEQRSEELPAGVVKSVAEAAHVTVRETPREHGKLVLVAHHLDKGVGKRASRTRGALSSIVSNQRASLVDLEVVLTRSRVRTKQR